MTAITKIGQSLKTYVAQHKLETGLFAATALVGTPLKLWNFNNAYKHQPGLSVSDKKLLMTQEWARQVVSSGLWLGSLVVSWGMSHRLFPTKSGLFHLIAANAASSATDVMLRPYATAALTHWLDSKSQRQIQSTGMPVMGNNTKVIVENRSAAQVAKSAFDSYTPSYYQI